jgi:hypothetical protein
MFSIYYIIDYQERQTVPLGLLKTLKVLGRQVFVGKKVAEGDSSSLRRKSRSRAW